MSCEAAPAQQAPAEPAAEPAAEPEARRLFLHGIPKWHEGERLQRWLAQILPEDIMRSVRVKKARGKPFCFVTFPSEEAKASGRAAIVAAKYDGRALTAAEPRAQRASKRASTRGDDEYDDDDEDGAHRPRKRARDAGAGGEQAGNDDEPGAGEPAAAARCVEDVVTPWWAVPYAQQLERKQAEMQCALVRMSRRLHTRVVQDLKHAYRREHDIATHMPIPQFRTGPGGTRQMIRFRTAFRPMDAICELEPIIASPATQGYRNKCEFTCGLDAAGMPCVGFRVGLFREGITSVRHCLRCPHVPLVAMALSAALTRFIEKSPLPVYNLASHSGVWRALLVRNSERTGDVMAMVRVQTKEVGEEAWQQEQRRLLDFFADPASMADACAAALARFSAEATATPARDAAVEGAGGAADADGADTAPALPPLPALEALAAALRVTTLLLQRYDGRSSPPPDHPVEVLAGSGAVEERMLDLRFRVSPGAFFQVNTPAAELLYAQVREWAAPGPRATVLDVCCGTGTIGLCMAARAMQVVGVDMCESAVWDARANARLNALTNTAFVAGRAEAVLRGVLCGARLDVGAGESVPEPQRARVTLDGLDGQGYLVLALPTATEAAAGGSGTQAEVVAVVDPPRSGLHPNVVNALRSCAAITRLVYVSCNPTASMPEDIVRLCCMPGMRKLRGVPFRPVRAQPVDLFPHTPHCELVMLLERGHVGGEEPHVDWQDAPARRPSEAGVPGAEDAAATSSGAAGAVEGEDESGEVAEAEDEDNGPADDDANDGV